jgi:hypothetical protein
MFVAFIYCLCLFALGTVVTDPFFGGFQEQAFDESPFLFGEQQGKCSLTILRISSFSLFCGRRTA